MTVSDILAIIGIAIAIIAFVSEKEREFISLKFNGFRIGIIIILLLVIHYLLAFEWIAERCNIFNIFFIDGYPSCDTWAYIVSLVLIVYLIRVISLYDFPKKSSHSLLKYYKRKIQDGEMTSLAKFLEKYHLKHIKKYLDTINDIDKQLETEKTGIKKQPFSIYQTRFLEQYQKRIAGKKMDYLGATILKEVIFDDIFIDNNANSSTTFFTEIIKKLKMKDFDSAAFVKRYLYILMTKDNVEFKKELHCEQGLGEDNSYRINENTPILDALMSDISVCAVNEAWFGIRKAEQEELEQESRKGTSILCNNDFEWDDERLWDFQIKKAIRFYDIMYRAAIVQNCSDIHSIDYLYFIKDILVNIRKNDESCKSGNYVLIDEIFSNMLDWCKIVIESKNTSLLKTIINCVGECLYEIAKTDKLPAGCKKELFDKMIMGIICYDKMDDKMDDKSTYSQVFKQFCEIIKKPSCLINSDDTNNVNKYFATLKNVWGTIDKVKFNGIFKERAQKVEDNLKPLADNDTTIQDEETDMRDTEKRDEDSSNEYIDINVKQVSVSITRHSK